MSSRLMVDGLANADVFQLKGWLEACSDAPGVIGVESAPSPAGTMGSGQLALVIAVEVPVAHAVRAIAAAISAWLRERERQGRSELSVTLKNANGKVVIKASGPVADSMEKQLS